MIKIVSPSVDVIQASPERDVLSILERIGRVSHKSEEKITPDSAAPFVRKIIGLGHESILEHVVVSLLLTVDRGVSHELVRHRLGSYNQESTRYCNYGRSNVVTIVLPSFFPDVPVGEYDSAAGVASAANWELSAEAVVWLNSIFAAADGYLDFLKLGRTPQEARAVLPNSLKTEVVVTYNLRQWRYFLSLRYFGTAGKPHPQMVEVSAMIYDYFLNEYPVIFSDLSKKYQRSGGIK